MLPFPAWLRNYTVLRYSWVRLLLVSLGTFFLLTSRHLYDLPHHPKLALASPTVAEIQHDACRSHNWSPFTPASSSSPPRKVYDMFLLNDELDWLTIRLHTLSPHIDYFVLFESPATFTAQPKALHYTENLPLFANFSHKIIHQVLLDPPYQSRRTWDYEDHQRNALFTQTFPSLSGPQTPHENDILLISDIDEIPRPSTISLLRSCNFPKRLTLRSKFYYYSFQFLHRGPEWAHPQATTFQGLENTILPQDLRAGLIPKNSFPVFGRLKAWYQSRYIENAAWHCSSCFGTISELLNKMSSFSHTGLNREVYRDRERIVDRVSKGLDLWDRPREVYDLVEGNEDLPDYLESREGKDRFAFMLDRMGEGAGFRDYVVREGEGESDGVAEEDGVGM